MEPLLYLAARVVVAVLQALPLRWVARLGRLVGGLAYYLDVRHRNVARRNLDRCFGMEKTRAEITRIAREAFRRIGEDFCCAIKTANMTFEELQPHLTFVNAERLLPPPGQAPENIVVAIGHFGNFELFVRLAQYAPAYQGATTYRSLRQPSLNRLMQRLREKSGCLFFERRTGAAALKQAMSKSGVLLGLLADQHAGDKGLRVPFFGHDCSTSAAPVIFARRYGCDLYTGFCFRTGLAQWRIELGPQIPASENGQPRALEDMALAMNQALEEAIRRDPANWFWVHNRWKPLKQRRNVAAMPRSVEADSPSRGRSTSSSAA